MHILNAIFLKGFVAFVYGEVCLNSAIFLQLAVVKIIPQGCSLSICCFKFSNWTKVS